jgi:hypothetical protein
LKNREQTARKDNAERKDCTAKVEGYTVIELVPRRGAPADPLISVTLTSVYTGRRIRNQSKERIIALCMRRKTKRNKCELEVDFNQKEQ